MKEIYLSISQIATMIGVSQYGYISDIIYNLWYKVDPEGYTKKIQEMEIKNNKSFKLLSEKDKFVLLTKDLDINLDDLENKTFDHNTLITKQTKILNDINNIKRDDIPEDDLINKKNALSKMVTSISNRKFGTHHEKTAILAYSKMTNTKISNQQKTIMAQIKKADIKYDAAWFIKGKIDGISISENDGSIHIIEIKNRTKTLFKCLKDYEKPQIQIYMKLFDIQKSHMVEYLKKSDQQDEMCIIDVDFEEEYWKFIKKRLNQFISFFYKFLKNKKMQELLLLQNINYSCSIEDSEIEKILRSELQNYFNEDNI